MKMKFLMAGVAIAAITATGCSSKIVATDGSNTANTSNTTNTPQNTISAPANNSGSIGNGGVMPQTTEMKSTGLKATSE